MAGRLDGKVAIITGASRGIGRVTALALAAEGARVTVAAKSVTERPNLPGTIYSVAEEIAALGSEALPYRCDVRQDDQIHEMVRATKERFGRIDILYNNAGALWWHDVAATPMKRFDLVVGVNARASFCASQAVLPHLEEAGGGHILVNSPPVQMSMVPHRVAYCISKFGMTMLAHGLAEEVRDQNIAVNAIWPVTLIESQASINHQLGGPKMWRKADILADAILEIVTTPPGELTGQALLDEDFLRSRGWTDFARYRCDPEHEPPRMAHAEIPEAGIVPR